MPAIRLPARCLPRCIRATISIHNRLDSTPRYSVEPEANPAHIVLWAFLSVFALAPSSERGAGPAIPRQVSVSPWAAPHVEKKGDWQRTSDRLYHEAAKSSAGGDRVGTIARVVRTVLLDMVAVLQVISSVVSRFDKVAAACNLSIYVRMPAMSIAAANHSAKSRSRLEAASA